MPAIVHKYEIGFEDQLRIRIMEQPPRRDFGYYLGDHGYYRFTAANGYRVSISNTLECRHDELFLHGCVDDNVIGRTTDRVPADILTLNAAVAEYNKRKAAGEALWNLA